jgi:hypothetical protein
VQQVVKITGWEAAQYDAALPDHQVSADRGGWFDAQAPGALQYDLMARGKIENLYANTGAAPGLPKATGSTGPGLISRRRRFPRR